MPARSVATLDPRESRFIAAVTALVLVGAIALGVSSGLLLLAIQTLVFAFGAVLGMHVHPYAALYRATLGRRLKPTTVRVAERPRRFGQALGMLLAVVALLLGTVGLSTPYYVLTGILLAAALAQAVVNFCVGCTIFRWLTGGMAITADLTDASAANPATKPSTAPRDITIG